MFVDIHTHKTGLSINIALQNLAFNEAEKVVSSTQEGYFSLGVHPWNADEFTTELLSKMDMLVTDKRMLAIGECGLDKNSKVSFTQQIKAFESQIKLSEKALKPLIIHCVGSFNELFEIKKRLNPSQKWILHGFRSKPQLAVQALKCGCSLSFGEHFNVESIRITPLKNLFVESDESEMPIEEIYSRIATIKGCETNDLSAGQYLSLIHISEPTRPY